MRLKTKPSGVKALHGESNDPRESDPDENIYLGALRTFALIVCAQRYCAGNATVICHALLRALVKLRF